MKIFLLVAVIIIAVINTAGLYLCIRVGGRHERD